ncbi:hypothetical protein LBMAG57_30700 [Verrucomicrobiota bacterium]|nr:hypothetical protein LBMAG57_30700 [Verrucomicrobiota bacterium]
MKSIRHIHRLVLAAIILICTFDASGATTVAVAAADFTKDKDGLAAFVFEVLQTELSARPDIELVDRKKLSEMLAEQGLGASGLTGEKAAQAGKLVGAGYYVFGESMKAGDRLAVSCRVVQVETGVLKPILVQVGKDEDPMAVGARLAKQVEEAIAKLSGRPSQAVTDAAPFSLPAGAVRPTLALRIPETSATPQQRRPDPAAEKALEAFFLKHEFKIVQLSRPSQGVEAAGISGHAPALHLEGAEHEALLLEARGKGADVIILGIATSDRGTQIGQFAVARARVEFAAVDTRTSKVLATTSGYGTGSDLSSFVAEKKAIESAATMLVPILAKKIVEGYGH